MCPGDLAGEQAERQECARRLEFAGAHTLPGLLSFALDAHVNTTCQGLTIGITIMDRKNLTAGNLRLSVQELTLVYTMLPEGSKQPEEPLPSTDTSRGMAGYLPFDQ